MNPGINIKLPLTYDSSDGPYKTNKSVVDAINQNLYVLFKTAPGERIMNTDYGIGINKYLFENFTPSLADRMKQDIRSQIKKYIKGLQVQELEVVQLPNENNVIRIALFYSIPSLNIDSLFTIVAS
jgi:phage baseplate assembly protein W